MDKRDLTAFESIMQGLAENFNSTLTANGIHMRFEALRKFSIEDVKSAALSIVAGRKYTAMPTIADFLEHLGGGSCEDRAEVEAAKVWQAVSKHGGWKTVVFDDPITQAVIHNGFGGWSKMCSELMIDQQKWFVKDFCRIYSAYSRQKVYHFGALLGRGIGEPVLIGDKAKAQIVLDTAQNEPITSLSGTIKKLVASISE